MSEALTRQSIIRTAREFLGTRFLHQGRNPATGLDCVGLLIVLAQRLGYPHQDVAGYRRTPSADTIRQMLLLNCDEIPLGEIRDGDIYLMRLGGIKPRHVSIHHNFNGRDSIIHASANGVRCEDKTNFPQSWFVAGFRLRGVID